MSLQCQTCKQVPQTPLWCPTCSTTSCPKCSPIHIGHESKLQFICQQCEQTEKQIKTVFCQNCQQHLCIECSQKIHNKGKRAKHILHNTSNQTMKIKKLFIACEDVLGYYGYINYGALLMDLADWNDGQMFLFMVEKIKDVAQIKSKIPVLIRSFNSEKQFGQDFCQNSKALYPFLQQMVFIESHRSCKLYDQIKQTKSLKATLHRMSQIVQKPIHNISNLTMSNISIKPNQQVNKSNISAKYPRQTRNNHLSLNISSSTENSLRKRKRKSPILYYHPFICMKGDKNCYIQNYYRELAAKGVLMVRREICEKFQERVLRGFFRNIGETQVQYVSLLLDTVSIECLYWVIRSIQEDHMAPTEKLILSRLKQSFDIKIHSKLWNHIIKYLSSNQYQTDRLQVDPMCNIPRLMVKPFNSEDSYILYCRPDNSTPVEWNYEDLGELDQGSQEWVQFLALIQGYFQGKGQIGGGRYGCVQYIKFNAKEPLRGCSLGKLSMFVQEAINKGIIRYHKTLLVSNKENDQSQRSYSQARTENKICLPLLQKSIKITTLQLLLLDNFRQYGQGTSISLAQIPQNLRKTSTFQINYIELGFPKLKNFLSTLSTTITLQLSKSHIVYYLKPQTNAIIKEKRERLCLETNQFIQETIRELVEIVDSSKLAGMALEELQAQFRSKTGVLLDFGVFNTTDFCQFLGYYGQNYFQIQVHMGYLIVYKKWDKQAQKNSSTPTFQDSEKQRDYKFGGLQNYEWGEANKIWSDETSKTYNLKQKQQEQQDQSESFSDYRSILNIIDDQSESKSFPKTVIQKQVSSKYGNNGLLGGAEEKSQAKNKINSYTNSDSINQLEDINCFKVGGGTAGGVGWGGNASHSKGQHNRMYSNNIQQRKEHYRMYSNMTRD